MNQQYIQARDMNYDDAEDKLIDLVQQLKDHKSGLYTLTFREVRNIQEEIKLLKYIFPGLIFTKQGSV